MTFLCGTSSGDYHVTPQSVSLFLCLCLSLTCFSAVPNLSATQVSHRSSAFPWKKHGSWAQVENQQLEPLPEVFLIL